MFEFNCIRAGFCIWDNQAEGEAIRGQEYSDYSILLGHFRKMIGHPQASQQMDQVLSEQSG